MEQKKSGCCAGCFGCTFTTAVLILIASFGMFEMMKRSITYQEAVERVQNDATVKLALGEPIQPGWWVWAKVDVGDDFGTADITIPISGPNGKGTIYAKGDKTGTQRRWDWVKLEVAIEGQDRRIDLLGQVEY